MAEIINLRQARKARARAAEDAKADENRIAFGRPKAARTLQQKRKALETDRHEGHRLEGGGPERSEPEPDPKAAERDPPA